MIVTRAQRAEVLCCQAVNCEALKRITIRTYKDLSNLNLSVLRKNGI